MAVSTAKVTWMNGLDPQKALAYLDSHMHDADSLDPGEKLGAMQEIANVVADLPDEFLGRYPALLGYLDEYSLEDAAADLREFYESLPEEAVLARCKCLKDRATLALAVEHDTIERKHRTLKCLEEVIGLQERSGLRFPEMQERVDVACMLLESFKGSEDEKAKDDLRAMEHIAIVEERLGGMQSHPFTSVIHIGLSWAYALLGMHKECLSHYEIFEELGVPTSHYAPLVRQREFKVCLALRALGFKEAVFDIRENASGLDENEAAWFASYESHDGFEEAALLARFLGIGNLVAVAGKLWFDSASATEASRHGYLPVSRLGLILDVTVHGIENDPVVFSVSSYPCGLPICKTVRLAELSTGLVFQPVASAVDVAGLVADEGSVYHAVYRRICLHTPGYAPSVEKLKGLCEDAFGQVQFSGD